jgi:hypothetical protein
MSETSFSIDDLPRFSPWPARLLGLEPWPRRFKTADEITREFEHEKWGSLLKKLDEANHAVSLDEVDRWSFEGSAAGLCTFNGRLELMTPKDAHERYLDLVQEILMNYMPASTLVELGCGYGSIILALAKRIPFGDMRIIAGEYTNSGVDLVKRLAVTEGLNIIAGHCDFDADGITAVDVPEGAIIFTSYATHYVPELPINFVQSLSARRPKAVVHIEPCYEHCDDNTLIGLMRRRYIELNDYNTNLVVMLREQQERGLIKILEERPAVFGVNPLLAASALVWVPQW